MAEEITEISVGQFDTVSQLIASSVSLQLAVIGLIIGIFQATTQIQEMTLTFVPKLVVMVLLLLFLGKWIAVNMMSYTATIFERVATIAG